MATALDLISLDRDVARAYAAVLRFRAELRAHPGSSPADPLAPFHHVAGRTGYEMLAAYPASMAEEPIRAGLLSWIHALTEVRVGFELEAELAREASAKTGLVRLETPVETSYDDAWRGAVFARDFATRQLWLEAAAELAPRLAPLARDAAARRVEVAQRLGLSQSANEEESAIPAPGLEAAARALLKGTADLREALRNESELSRAAETPRARLSAWIGDALGTDAPEGWPARLTARWFQESFPEMARGANLTLKVPRVAGASSFACALAGFGAALREGGRSGLPFSVAKSPQGTDAHRLGLVFGSLPSEALFHRRVLGLGERAAEKQARSLARTALLETVGVAAGWLLSRDGHEPSRIEWEEVVHEAFGGPLDTRFHGAWPKRRLSATPRFEALLTARPLAGELVSRFDVDWFRNPRAGAFLRARAGGPAGVPPETELDPLALASRLVQELEEALG